MTAWDYIVAGGGSAGCALAARLAEDPSVSVLLVEAGGKGRPPFVTMPAGNGFPFGNPRCDRCLQGVPQPGLGGRQVSYQRGKALVGHRPRRQRGSHPPAPRAQDAVARRMGR